MSRATILHLLTPARNPSPFDVNMAVDAGWQHCMPYSSVTLDEVAGLTQDAIFSRGPKGVQQTGLFIGGRDPLLAMDMLEAAAAAMVPPFSISIFADPSGCFTTAAAMVACVESRLREQFDGASMQGRRALVFGGTGPVGSVCALLAARAGAEAVIVSHEGREAAERVARAYGERFGLPLSAADGSDASRIGRLLADAELVFSAAKAGVQVLSADLLRQADALQVACDVNAVPPAGIEGLDPFADGVRLAGPRQDALGIGALAVGNIKYQTQQRLLQRMIDAGQPQRLAFEDCLEVARGLL